MRNPPTNPILSQRAQQSEQKKAPQKSEARKTGGEGGIRTHGDVATTPDFESRTIRCRRHQSYLVRYPIFFV